MAQRLPRERRTARGYPLIARGDEFDLCGRYFSGSTVVLEEPSGADCMPGGVWPCGLSGGAPPVPVVIGPVQPCGCFSPFTSGTTVRPVLHSDLSVSPGRYPDLSVSLLACAHVKPVAHARQTAINEKTHCHLHGLSYSLALRYPLLASDTKSRSYCDARHTK